MKTRRLVLLSTAIAVLPLLAFASGRSVIFDWYHQSSASMEPTIPEHSRFVLVLKCAYQIRLPFTYTRLLIMATPSRGDVALIRNPDGDGPVYLKRVIGLAGDSIELRNERLFLNGKSVPLELRATQDRNGESAITGTESLDRITYQVLILPDRPALRSFGPVTVPPGHVFVLGDNRDLSRDSRFFGSVPTTYLLGRVLNVRGARA